MKIDDSAFWDVDGIVGYKVGRVNNSIVDSNAIYEVDSGDGGGFE